MAYSKSARRILGRSLMILGHVFVVAMAFIVPLAIVSLGQDPVEVMAVSFAAMLILLGLIVGGDWIAGRRRPAPAAPAAAGRARRADSSVPRRERSSSTAGAAA